MNNNEAVTDKVAALTVGPLRLRKGEEVLVEGRANPDFVATVVRVEFVKSFYPSNPGTYYLHLEGHSLLYPVADVIEVVSR